MFSERRAVETPSPMEDGQPLPEGMEGGLEFQGSLGVPMGGGDWEALPEG